MVQTALTPLISISNRVVLLLVVCIGIIAGVASTNEYFSSVDQMQRLGDLELRLVETFRHFFIEREKEFSIYRKYEFLIPNYVTLAIPLNHPNKSLTTPDWSILVGFASCGSLGRFIEHVRAQHSLASKNVEEFLGNPINAFTLIKRMGVDWNQMHESIKASQARNGLKDHVAKVNIEMKIPEDEEMRGAIMGLVRLQRIYNLTAADMAEGIINGVQYGTDLNWHDCFEIATGMFDLRELPLAITWFEVTLALLQDMADVVGDDEIAIADGGDIDLLTYKKFTLDSFEYLAIAHFDLGHTDEAIMYIDSILAISPEHHAKDTRTYMLSSVASKSAVGDPIINHNWYANYTRLCRGIQLAEKVHRKLKCRLETQNNPYFILAPLKKEELSLNPKVVLYHGLLNDDQIDAIRMDAKSNMERSKAGGEVTEIRVSQQSWLAYTSRVMQFIHRLLMEVTGMDMRETVAETMQVANYGIGGQYGPHYDFLGSFRDEYFAGDRIMTNMFYLSDVEQGGYTAFPNINVFLRPVKGAMVSWYNLHRSLDPDLRTLHAGCPVIKGSKRIGNVWIHSGYQELRHPCTLHSDTYLSAAYA